MWINVQEKKPSYSKSVLVAYLNEYKHLEITFKVAFCDLEEIDSIEVPVWFDDETAMQINAPDFWMEIPEIP